MGVKEDRTTHAADSFPGIPDAELAVAEQSLRNASKDLLHPPVFYNLRNFSGPIESIGLKRGHSIITVHIPEGPDSPYIHNDGRVYRRVGDASQPTHITDRSTFDLLAQRGERARSRLADRILWIPIVSQAEERQPFVHFTIMSDPYEVMGHWYDGSFTNFSTIMKGFRLPFDNIFSTSEGYIARQVKGGDPYYRGFTWDFSKRCHSFVTVPLTTLAPTTQEPAWKNYPGGVRFLSKLREQGFTSARILDLNLMVDLVGAIIRRHRILVAQAGITGPLFIKAHLEDVWRTVPFLSHSGYLKHIEEYGLPIVQDSDFLTPPGTSLDSFVVSPDIGRTPSEDEYVDYDGPLSMSMRILSALGIPMEVLAQSAEDLRQIGQLTQDLQNRILGS